MDQHLASLLRANKNHVVFRCDGECLRWLHMWIQRIQRMMMYTIHTIATRAAEVDISTVCVLLFSLSPSFISFFHSFWLCSTIVLLSIQHAIVCSIVRTSKQTHRHTRQSINFQAKNSKWRSARAGFVSNATCLLLSWWTCKMSVCTFRLRNVYNWICRFVYMFVVHVLCIRCTIQGNSYFYTIDINESFEERTKNKTTNVSKKFSLKLFSFSMITILKLENQIKTHNCLLSFNLNRYLCAATAVISKLRLPWKCLNRNSSKILAK